MPSLAVCRCLFRLMRHCFLGRWTCLLVSESLRLVWKCRLFDYSTYIQFCGHWHRGQCLRRLVQNYAVAFRLGRVYLPELLCHRRSRRLRLHFVSLITPWWGWSVACMVSTRSQRLIDLLLETITTWVSGRHQLAGETGWSWCIIPQLSFRKNH